MRHTKKNDLTDNTNVVKQIPPDDMPYRDPAAVDRILGPKIKPKRNPNQFKEWPLWQVYPEWHDHMARIAELRAKGSE